MVALFSPPLFSTKGWLLEEEPFGYNNTHNLSYKDDASSQYSFPYQFYSPQTQIEVEIERSTAPSSDPAMVKKLSHNASERDRRKKVNNLVSSLRSLLPMADQTVLLYLYISSLLSHFTTILSTLLLFAFNMDLNFVSLI